MPKLIIGIVFAVLLSCRSVAAATDSLSVQQGKQRCEWLDEDNGTPGFSYSVGADVVSVYLWRGFAVGGLSFQPSASVSYAGVTFGLWWNLGADSYLFRSFFPEQDTYISFSRWGMTLSLTHMHYFDGSRFFNLRQKDIYGGGNSNNFEMRIGYRVSDRLPLYINWFTHLAGEDGYVTDATGNFVARNMRPGDNIDGLKVKRAFSTYIQIGYDFTLPYQLTLPVCIGMTPWKSRYTYYEGSFAVTCLSAGLRREFDLKLCKLSVFGTLALNPYRINAENAIVGIRERDWRYNDTNSHLTGTMGVGVRF